MLEGVSTPEASENIMNIMRSSVFECGAVSGVSCMTIQVFLCGLLFRNYLAVVKYGRGLVI